MKNKILALTILLSFITCSDKPNSKLSRSSNFEENYKTNNENNFRKPITENSIDNSKSKFSSKKYFFVYLKVVENTGKGYDDHGILQAFLPEEKHRVTKIGETEFLDDLTKTKIEDEVINAYLSSPSTAAYEGRILAREVFVFDSYQAASKKRNSFLIPEN